MSGRFKRVRVDEGGWKNGRGDKQASQGRLPLPCFGVSPSPWETLVHAPDQSGFGAFLFSAHGAL